MSYLDSDHFAEDIRVLEGYPLSGTHSRFTVLEQVGTGSLTRVYRAFDHHLKQTVAIKLLSAISADATVANTLVREAGLARQVTHPNVVRIFDVHESKGRTFITMEYVDGPSLRVMLNDPGSITVSDAVDLAVSIAAGLSAIHQTNIIHADLRPENILLSPGRPVITDLGLACLLREILPGSAKGGSLLYLSPEQTNGDALDPSTDVYSFGLLFFELLTGKHFLTTNNRFYNTLTKVNTVSINDPRAYNVNVPEELAQIVRCCLDVKARRYPTAVDLQKDLQNTYVKPVNIPFSQIADQHRNPAGGSAVFESGLSARNTNSISPYRTTTSNRWFIVLGAGLLAVIVLAMYYGGIQMFWLQKQVPLKQIAILPFSLTTAPASIRDAFDTVQRNTHTDLSMIARDVNIWHLDRGTSEAFPASISKPTLIIRGQLQCDGYHLILTGTVEHGNIKGKLSHFRAEGTTRDLLEFKQRLLRAMVDNSRVQQVLVRTTVPKAPTTNASAYALYCEANGILHRTDDVEELRRALRLLDEAIRFDPKFVWALATEATVQLTLYRSTHDERSLSQAWAPARSAYELDPHGGLAVPVLAAIYLETGRANQAVQLLEDPLFHQTDTSLRVLGAALLAQGAARDASTVVQKSLHLNPLSFDSYLLLGECYTRLGDNVAAARTFSTALELDPKQVEALNNLGECYIRIGKPAEAIDKFVRSLELRPDSISYWNLATAYMATEHDALAEPLLSRASQLDPTSDIFVGYLGAVYQSLGDARARRTLLRASELARQRSLEDPMDCQVVARLALYDARLGDVSNALRQIAIAEHLCPVDLDVQYRRALVLVLSHRNADAVITLQELAKRGYTLAFQGHDPDVRLLECIPNYVVMRHKYGAANNGQHN